MIKLYKIFICCFAAASVVANVSCFASNSLAHHANRHHVHSEQKKQHKPSFHPHPGKTEYCLLFCHDLHGHFTALPKVVDKLSKKHPNRKMIVVSGGDAVGVAKFGNHKTCAKDPSPNGMVAAWAHLKRVKKSTFA